MQMWLTCTRWHFVFFWWVGNLCKISTKKLGLLLLLLLWPAPTLSSLWGSWSLAAPQRWFNQVKLVLQIIVVLLPTIFSKFLQVRKYTSENRVGWWSSSPLPSSRSSPLREMQVAAPPAVHLPPTALLTNLLLPHTTWRTARKTFFLKYKQKHEWNVVDSIKNFWPFSGNWIDRKVWSTGLLLVRGSCLQGFVSRSTIAKFHEFDQSRLTNSWV